MAENVYVAEVVHCYYKQCIKIEFVAETEQDARILAAHCCGLPVKTIKSIKCIHQNYDGEPYFKTLETIDL